MKEENNTPLEHTDSQGNTNQLPAQDAKPVAESQIPAKQLGSVSNTNQLEPDDGSGSPPTGEKHQEGPFLAKNGGVVQVSSIFTAFCSW